MKWESAIYLVEKNQRQVEINTLRIWVGHRFEGITKKQTADQVAASQNAAVIDYHIGVILLTESPWNSVVVSSGQASHGLFNPKNRGIEPWHL
ncbi:MAG TPA: hypothetical protein VN774_02965, partial [Candidatus Limnocylindrales bacterium]|nr:hypothetical protein [Candidatus Limnocylindrales bacterium]